MGGEIITSPRDIGRTDSFRASRLDEYVFIQFGVKSVFQLQFVGNNVLEERQIMFNLFIEKERAFGPTSDEYAISVFHEFTIEVFNFYDKEDYFEPGYDVNRRMDLLRGDRVKVGLLLNDGTDCIFSMKLGEFILREQKSEDVGGGMIRCKTLLRTDAKDYTDLIKLFNRFNIKSV